MGNTLKTFSNNNAMDNTQWDGQPAPPFPEEDWPWIWAIENQEHLDWIAELPDDDPAAFEKTQRAQSDLPVLISSPAADPDSSTSTNIQTNSPSSCSMFLSDAWNAHKVDRLQSRGITHVLNVAGRHAQGNLEAYQDANIISKTIKAEDEEGYPMLERHWDEFQHFVQSTPPGSKIVVHCVAGQNRSGLLVAAHKLVTEHVNVLDVVAHLRKQRGNGVLSNQSFIAQLVALARTRDLLGPKPGEPGCRVSGQAPAFEEIYRKSARNDIKNLF